MKESSQEVSIPRPIDLASPNYYDDTEEIPPSPTEPLGIEEDHTNSVVSSRSSSYTSSSLASSLLSSSASSAPSSLLSETSARSPTTTSPAFAALSLFPYSPPPPSPSRSSAPSLSLLRQSSEDIPPPLPYSYQGKWCDQEKLFKVDIDMLYFPKHWRYIR